MKLGILIKKETIIRFIKSQRLRWAHVIRMHTIRTVKKLTEWEPCSSRPVGRPRLRQLKQVEEDLKKMKVRNWREKCKDRRLWNEIVKQAKTHQGLQRQSKKKKKKKKEDDDDDDDDDEIGYRKRALMSYTVFACMYIFVCLYE